MTSPSSVDALYATRAAAGAQLGRQLYQRVLQPAVVLAVTPSGVEVAAHAAKAMACPFDVVVAAPIQVEGVGIVGAVAEDGDAVMDPDFQPGFQLLEVLEAAVDAARRAVKTERLLFRGQRPLRSVEGANVVIVDGHVSEPWKVLAAAQAITPLEPARVAIAAAAATQPVKDRVLARRLDFICPSVVMDPAGHPRPFGDPQDPSAERLRSIVVAREAA